jgi:hypothetical protein
MLSRFDKMWVVGGTSHDHQPINAPTAGAQAYLMDYPQEARAITLHAGPVRVDGWRDILAVSITYVCLFLNWPNVRQLTTTQPAQKALFQCI